MLTHISTNFFLEKLYCSYLGLSVARPILVTTTADILIWRKGQEKMC